MAEEQTRGEPEDELQELDQVEKRLLAEIERTERENQEIDQCIKQNGQIMEELKE